MAEGGELKRRENTITAEAMGGRKDVAGLFTAEGSTAGDHRRVHMLVPNWGALQHPSPTLPGPLKTEVGHHRGHQTLIRKGLAVRQY